MYNALDVFVQLVFLVLSYSHEEMFFPNTFSTIYWTFQLQILSFQNWAEPKTFPSFNSRHSVYLLLKCCTNNLQPEFNNITPWEVSGLTKATCIYVHHLQEFAFGKKNV